MAPTTSSTVKITPASAETLEKGILTSHGVPSSRAELIAAALVLADLRGVDTHGINRLAGYISRLIAGVVQAAPEIKITKRKKGEKGVEM
jgi:LDH2 family malate/lactate/ureidoglycolate dehydrogenase